MSRFIKKFRFTRSFEEGVRLKDRGLKILSVSRYDLFDLESLLAIFYTGYNKASVYPERFRSFFIERHSSIFSNTTTIKLFEKPGCLLAEITQYIPGFLRFGSPEFKILFANKAGLLELTRVKKKNKVNQSSGEQFDIIGDGECVCRIQITSPVRSGFFFSGISSRPIAGFIEVMEGFEEVPSVLCFLQLFEMYQKEEDRSNNL
ncbi:MAG TPA: hypothetical protein PK328_13405 [Chitinophagaceae bacterium]|nr:hypothetical protein [Chitinophagaceae bacterium]